MFSESTLNDYSIKVIENLLPLIKLLVGDCRLEDSDRLPSYSIETKDIVRVKNDMELCSISKRTDYEGAKVLEIAFGLDRLIFNMEDHENG